MTRNTVFSFGALLASFSVLSATVYLSKTAIAGDCTFALDALATCQQADTGNCSQSCANSNTGVNGTVYSQNTVYTTTTGNSASNGTENIDCSRPMTCTATPQSQKACIFSACGASDGYVCYTFTKTLGNWVPSPSAKIKACPA